MAADLLLGADVLAGLAGAPTPAPASLPTWPCLECQSANPMDLDECATCGSPFGASWRTPMREIKGTRRSRLLLAVGAVLGFLLLVAVITFATTGAPPASGNPADTPNPSGPSASAGAPIPTG